MTVLAVAKGVTVTGQACIKCTPCPPVFRVSAALVAGGRPGSGGQPLSDLEIRTDVASPDPSFSLTIISPNAVSISKDGNFLFNPVNT